MESEARQNKVLNALKFWPELLVLICFVVLGIQSVDAWRERETAYNNYRFLEDFQYTVSELTVATLMVDYATTENYDKQAQLLLKAEDIWREMSLKDDLQYAWQSYNDNVAHFIQLASILKTSRRFISDSEREFDNHLNSFGAVGKPLIALLFTFETRLNDDIAQNIRDYIVENETSLAQISDSGMQWPMLKLHIEFVLNNAEEVSQLIRSINEQPLYAVLQQHTRQSGEQWDKASRYFYLVTTLLIFNVLAILVCVFARQAVALKYSSRKAFAAADAKSQFLANMSHEIRTPLNGIIGLADICLRTPLDKVQKGYMEKLLFSGKSLLTIINDILDFSKIESKKLDIVPVDFEVEALLSNIKTMSASQASEKGLELIFVITSDVPRILHGDNIRIGQVLLNLVGNAVKFTSEGHVVIRLEKVPNQAGDDHYRFSVEDTGIGLSAVQISKLFSRFTQADSSTTRKFGGTGLGLAISKLLVELMHGQINVESEPGKGSQFCFSLPLGPAIQTEDEQEADFPDPQLHGKSLLVLEDHPITMEVTCNMASQLGLKVTAVDTVKEAAQVSAKQHFDFALVDWHLPNLNGGLLLKKWEHTKVHPTNIIIFTAFDSDVFRNESGIVDKYRIINKPILLHQLHDAFLDEAGDDEGPSIEVDNNAVASTSARVLLVEDNEINQMVAKEMLVNMHVEVDIAENGLQAIEKVNTNQYNLVLMDIQMPEMDGIQATTKLRETYSMDSLPIIALTANVMKDETEKYLQIGMNDHLGKPFERQALSLIVEKYVR